MTGGPCPFGLEVDCLEPRLLDPLVHVGAACPASRIFLQRVPPCLWGASNLCLYEQLNRAVRRIRRIEIMVWKYQAWHGASPVECLAGAVLQDQGDQVGEEIPLAVLVVALVGEAQLEVAVELPHGLKKWRFDVRPAPGLGEDRLAIHLV